MTEPPGREKPLVWTEGQHQKVPGAVVKWVVTLTYFSFPSSQAKLAAGRFKQA